MCLSTILECTVCPAKNEGLVRYPTALSTVRGSYTLTAECADNAHVRSGSILNVVCTSSGTWSGTIPQCECDEAYRRVTVNRKQICVGGYVKKVKFKVS